MKDRLKPISGDCLGKDEAWALKVVGDTSEYRAMGKGKETINYGYVCIKRLGLEGMGLWSTTTSNGRQSTSAAATRAVANGITPEEPESVLSECPDRSEQPEPNIPKEEAPKPVDE